MPVIPPPGQADAYQPLRSRKVLGVDQYARPEWRHEAWTTPNLVFLEANYGISSDDKKGCTEARMAAEDMNTLLQSFREARWL
jgi:hypothetical protein